MVKISAVVDSGAEASALPENVKQWIPLKPSSGSSSGKDLSRRRERFHPCARREVGDWPNG